MIKILKNGNIHTMNNESPLAKTIVIEDDTIIYVGDNIEEEKLASFGDAVIYDLDQKMVIPGLIDSHTHPGMVAQSTWHIDMPWFKDVKEVISFIKDFAEKHTKEELPFLYFQYYPTSMFDENGPSKELLDEAVLDRPCYVQDFGGHLCWVNSKMLEMMEVTKDTPDPVPGLEMFVRDKNNEPTGWIKEWAWRHFEDTLWENIGWWPPMEITADLMLAVCDLNREYGITAVGDGTFDGESQIKSMRELDKTGKMNFYYDGIVRFRSLNDLPEKIAESKRLNFEYGSKHIKFNTMKLFLDGTNESGNSASLYPHLNDLSGNNYGEIKMDVEELSMCLLLCNKEAQDIQIHMVGDRAFRVACDAVEKAKQEAENAKTEWQTKIIFLHCELIHSDDMARPSQLGVIINWTPHWAGGYFGEEAIKYFGKERWDRMYQFNPIIESGALVAFSSDVVSLYEMKHRSNPFFNMQIGHTRIDPEITLSAEKYTNSMRPMENAKLSREVLLEGFTITGAKQLRRDDKLGSIEVGKTANINILSEDYFSVQENKIKDITSEVVFFDGDIIKGGLSPYTGVKTK